MTRGKSSNRYRWQGFLPLLPVLFANAVAHAAPDDVYVPEELRPWVGWVLQDKEYLDCPFFFDQAHAAADNFVCTWPGELELDVTGTGAGFSQRWTVYASGQWVPLPGDGNVWPEQVTANGQAVELVLQANTPSVRLAPGQYTLEGRFAWNEAPRVLNVPAKTGLLSLTVDGSPVARPERNQDSVWLAERETQTQAQDSLDVQVYRLVADDVPTRLTSNLNLDVSGNVREVVLGPVLPDALVPLSLDSPLPARLEADGRLRLQVRPGTWQVRLVARGSGVMNEVTLPDGAEQMPDAEIWSYRSNDRLRVTTPEGPVPVDPGQVSTPDEWRELPAFRIQPGETLNIVEQSRGRLAADNQLQLNRQLWMDFDSTGFVFADSITGTMRSDWRLDVVEPYVLLSASENGQNLLVTLGPEDGMTGVELRQRSVALQAIGRSETRGELPVTGWQTRFDAAGVTLNLPPGHKLFAAPGADAAPGSWMERWKLLDFFLVLIVTIATARLFGWQGGAIAFVALALSWHENNSPQWIWLNLLAAIALARAAPEGRLKRAAQGYRTLSFAVLVVVLVPFAAEQLRIGIYPQLESQRGFVSTDYVQQDSMGAAAPASAVRDRRELMLKNAAEVEEVVVTGIRGSRSYARYAPNAIVQAGPGKPSWSWNTYRLDWSGPVDAHNTLKLIVMPRWLVSSLRFAGVLLLLALAALLAFETFNRRMRLPWDGHPRDHLPPVSPALFGALLVAGTFTIGVDAKAQAPSPELLQQLEQRLLEPPECEPRCAEIPAAHIELDARTMSIRLEVHALENVAVPLPGSLAGWRPEIVQVDGSPAGVYRRADQTLWIRAPGGTHQVTLQGPLPPVDSLEVPFPAPPRVITVRASDWSLSGIRDRRLVSGSLHLARLQAAGEDPSLRWEGARFPVFARVERTVELDLDWRVTTQVVRVAPQQGAFTLDVPLVDGEAIVSGDFQVRDEKVRVSMGPGQRVVSWESTLPRTSPLALQAASAPWKEVWRFGVSSIWHVNFDGVPESEPESELSGARVLEFYPRAGETLNVEAERPEASGGTSLAFDSVSLGVEVGARSRSVTLDLAYRSTRGVEHNIRLPDEAHVQSVAIDGRNESLRPKDGVLSLPILPGEHRIEVRWRDEVAAGIRTGTPAVDIAAPASNIQLGVELPQSRWILATSGPRLGPAVMYWSELAALILAAIILGRLRLAPLSTRQWLLLGIGFSTFSWAALALVALWLLVMGARERLPTDLSWWRFDLVQLLLAALSLAALVAILVTVPSGLLGSPDMHVLGNNSWGSNLGSSLNWFADRSDGLLPAATVTSLPLWVYKVLILAWALWLSFALLRWLPWAWSRFVSQGLWRSRDGRATAGAGQP